MASRSPVMGRGSPSMGRSQSMGALGQQSNNRNRMPGSIQPAPAHIKTAGKLSDAERDALYSFAHHHEETPNDEELKRAAFKQIPKTHKTTMMIPEEKMVKVPVVRKEKEKVIEKVTFQGSKLIPMTKYKEVREIDIQNDQHLTPNKRLSQAPACVLHKTFKTEGRTRQIPYQDFEEQPVPVTIEVPREKVMTRVGHRMDKVKQSRYVELEEDVVYEMRPFLLKRGETRANELRGKERHGKSLHGDPIWEDKTYEGWRPDLGAQTPDNSRPSTPGQAANVYRTLEREQSRPGTGLSQRSGTRSAPNLYGR